MGDPERDGDAHITALRRVLAASPSNRRAELSDAVVEFGEALIMTIASHDDPVVQGLLDEAFDIHTDWLTGKRVSRRADEAERRFLEARELARRNPEDASLGRIAADATMRLPEDHELRDVVYARETLLRLLAEARHADENDFYVAAFYLLHHSLLTLEKAALLIREGMQLLRDRAASSAAIKDFLVAAHGYSLTCAAEDWRDGGPAYGRWLRQGDAILDEARRRFPAGDARLGTMEATQLDIEDEKARAAARYGELLEARDLTQSLTQFQALSAATLYLQLGHFDEVARLTGRMVPITIERYLTAVTDSDVQEAGFINGRALTLLVSSLMHLEHYEPALQMVDLSKSLRLRYRAALARHPERRVVLDLEMKILAASRGGNTVAATGAEVSLRAQLQEEYRKLRPDLSEDVAQPRSVEKIAEVLDRDEGAVILAVCDDMTVIALVTPRSELDIHQLDRCPWEDWMDLLGGPGGWLDTLAGRPEGNGPSALSRLIHNVDRVLGQPIRRLAKEEGLDRLTLIPHRWLHLVPYWALPSLSDFQVAMYSSADEMIRTRSRYPASQNDDLVAVTNPTGDLLVSASETQSALRLQPRSATVLGPSDPARATVDRLAEVLPNAGIFHFSGHAHSDHGDPDSSALLVAARDAGDPFPGLVSAVHEWSSDPDGWRHALIPSVGRLGERLHDSTQTLERRLERGSEPTVYARYSHGALRCLGELWSAGDIIASGQVVDCQLAFLSACDSGHAGGRSGHIDEYGGLPAALRLGGARTIVCSMWSVDEGFAALYVDLFYEELTHLRHDPVSVARGVGRRLRQASTDEVLARVAQMADNVRPHRPVTALTLEAYASQVAARVADRPFANPWDWAAFYALGGQRLEPGQTSELSEE